jgi:hemoglobin
MASEFRQPLHPAITEEMIHILVHGFYAKVRQDAVLGPIFNRVIGDGWDHHLGKMCDFWSSVMMMTGRYKGTPMVAHMRLKMVRPEHFQRWLQLFGETVGEVTPPEVAPLFLAKAQIIARSLQMGMFFQPSSPLQKENQP